MLVSELAQEKLLTQQIRGMLAYWCEATKELNNDTVVMLEAERQNLLRAVQVGLLFPQNSPDTAEILTQTFPFIEQRAYWQEWIPLLERCLNGAPNLSVTNQVLLMARLGQAYRLDRELERAIAIHLEAEQLANTTGQDALIGRIQHDLLEDYLFARKYEKAIEIGQSAITVLKKDGQSKSLLANSYKMLGVSFLEKEEPETAENHLTIAVNLWRSLGDPLFLARTLSELARPRIILNKYDQAEENLQEAADLLRPTIYEIDKCLLQINLGHLYAAQQNWTKAESALHRANSPYLRQSANLHRKALVKNNLGFVLYIQQRYEIADEYLKQAADLWEQAHDKLEAGNTLSTLADSYAAQKKYEIALPLYEQVIKIFRDFPENARARRLLKQYEPVPDQIKARQKNSQPS